MKTTHTVCLDAGHDAGNKANRSPDGSYYEHEFALDMAKRIGAILREAGVNVVETRPNGQAVSLGNRCQMANEVKADLFVSLHSNAAGSEGWSGARGWECYTYGESGAGAEAAWAITRQIQAAGVMTRGRPVTARPNLYVLRHTAAPAVLIEHGFHTSQADVSLLRQPSYRQLLAAAEARGILLHLGVIKAEEKQAPEKPAAPSETDEALRWVKETGIMQGSAQGDMMPEKAVTRRELAVILYRMNMRRE